MRIVGGKYRGKVFTPPSNLKARPTTDFGKEALFNIINNMYNFENLDVLDLFSGTGSISYEFISRGVKSVTAIESNVNNAKFIERQFVALNTNQATVIKSDVFRYLKSCRRKFDVVFADPPYDLENLEQIYHSIFDNDILTESALLVIEHSDKQDFSSYPFFSMMRNYGSVHFSFFEN